MKIKLATVIAVVALGAALSACASDKAKSSSTSDPTTSLVKATSTTRAPARAVAMLNIDDSPLGPIVRDENGNTLYAFANDNKGESTCYDACATAWPPARKTDVNLTASGIDPGLLGTTKRKDGTTQLTLNNWPLYRFAADGSGTGSLKGQGNKGLWFVLNGDGKLLKNGVAGGATTSSTTPARNGGKVVNPVPKAGSKTGQAAGTRKPAATSTTTTTTNRFTVENSAATLQAASARC
jgi:predicted lipoprotein with Yx(FWY)xxD motif